MSYDFIQQASQSKLQIGYVKNKITGIEIAPKNDKGSYRIDFKFEKGGKYSTWLEDREIESKTGKFIYRDNRGNVSIYVSDVDSINSQNFEHEKAVKCKVGEPDLINLLKVAFNYNKKVTTNFPTFDFSKLEEGKLLLNGSINLADTVEKLNDVVTIYGVKDGKYLDVLPFFVYPYQLDSKNVEKTTETIAKRIVKYEENNNNPSIFAPVPLQDWNESFIKVKEEIAAKTDNDGLPF